jgi:multiple sugar transport system substrate-binding protein
LLGGGSLGISKQSRYPEDALQFISWVATDPVASCIALLGGNPITKETLTNYEVVDVYPWMEMLSTGFTRTQCNRTPSHDNAPFNDHRLVSLLGECVRNCWFLEKDINQELENACKIYQREKGEFTY